MAQFGYFSWFIVTEGNMNIDYWMVYFQLKNNS